MASPFKHLNYVKIEILYSTDIFFHQKGQIMFKVWISIWYDKLC